MYKNRDTFCVSISVNDCYLLCYKQNAGETNAEFHAMSPQAK